VLNWGNICIEGREVKRFNAIAGGDQNARVFN
jgi:hypothetical protein